jgi:hypothetical protein
MARKLIPVLILLPLLLTGCGIMAITHPSGAAMGNIYGTVTYPTENTSMTEYKVTGNEFEIVGPVRGEGQSKQILGVYAEGDSGYEKALKQAREMGCDDIMNLRVDTKYFNVLFGAYTVIDTIVTGTGIKWKK